MERGANEAESARGTERAERCDRGEERTCTCLPVRPMAFPTLSRRAVEGKRVCGVIEKIQCADESTCSSGG